MSTPPTTLDISLKKIRDLIGYREVKTFFRSLYKVVEELKKPRSITKRGNWFQDSL